jgi:protoporphyrinogen oxidase
MWLPLLRSKLGPNAELASAAFIWAIIVRMYGARNAGAKQESMGYLRGGYDAVLPVLRRYVESSGVRVVTDARVTAVRSSGDGATIDLHNGGIVEVDDAVLTLPCARILALCQGLSPNEQARLGRVLYQGVVCPSYLLRRPLKGYYVTNITDAGIPFTGVIEMSALVDREWFGGRHLVYLPRYVTPADPVWQRSDDEIADEFFAALQRMVPDLKAEDVVARRVARAKEVLAISTLRYSTDVMPPLRTSLPHVFIANSAQIAQGTLNVDETVSLAERSATALSELLSPAREVAQHA